MRRMQAPGSADHYTLLQLLRSRPQFKSQLMYSQRESWRNNANWVIQLQPERRKKNKELTPRSRSTLLIVLRSFLCLSSLCFILWSWSEKSIILWSEQGPLIRLDFPCLPAKHDALPSLACLKEDFQFEHSDIPARLERMPTKGTA